jgi:hypothetical protein
MPASTSSGPRREHGAAAKNHSVAETEDPSTAYGDVGWEKGHALVPVSTHLEASSDASGSNSCLARMPVLNTARSVQQNTALCHCNGYARAWPGGRAVPGQRGRIEYPALSKLDNGSVNEHQHLLCVAARTPLHAYINMHADHNTPHWGLFMKPIQILAPSPN